jgi:hypothetical protein
MTSKEREAINWPVPLRARPCGNTRKARKRRVQRRLPTLACSPAWVDGPDVFR